VTSTTCRSGEATGATAGALRSTVALRSARNLPQPQCDITVAPGYHPEFGYLCPSVAVRQRVRLGIISAGIGMLIGAGLMLSLMDRRFADSQRNEQISTAGKMDQDWAAIGQAAEHGNEVAPVANQSGASMSGVWGACSDEADAFLNKKCRLIKRRGARASGSIAPRLATIEVGRSRSAVESGQQRRAWPAIKWTAVHPGR
jgi:hypothetical protein